MREHIGPYQRPAPPKKPLRLGAPRAVQQPAVPMHQIEARGQVLLQDLIDKVRKPGRPSVHEEPMTAAQRQARRRGIQEALRISDVTEKAHAEAASGGWGAKELDHAYGTRGDGESSWNPTTGGGRQTETRPASDDNKSHKVHVRGLQIGDEETNRRLFAMNELGKMIGEYFVSPTVSPSAQWIGRHVSSVPIQQSCSQSLALTCKVCSDVMESVGDAADHLRVDHRDLICEWFGRLDPPREFRDMRSYVTVVVPRRRKSLKKQALMSD